MEKQKKRQELSAKSAQPLAKCVCVFYIVYDMDFLRAAARSTEATV